MLRKELRQRLAKEYRYAITKMQESPQPAKKLFYFSVFFSEAQRTLNWQWDKDLSLIYAVTHFTHTQINAGMQTSTITQALPIDWDTVYEKLILFASDLTAYFEKTEKGSGENLYQILVHFAEIAYAVTGNGSYLYEKGFIEL